MLTKDFWTAAAERAGRTFAQALIPLVIAAGTDVLKIDWLGALGLALGSSLLSLLMSLAAGRSGTGPSFGAEVVVGAVAAKELPVTEHPDDTITVAGPAAEVPEGTPVDVVPQVAEGWDSGEFGGEQDGTVGEVLDADPRANPGTFESDLGLDNPHSGR